MRSLVGCWVFITVCPRNLIKKSFHKPRPSRNSCPRQHHITVHLFENDPDLLHPFRIRHRSMASYVAQPTVLSGNIAMPSALPPHAAQGTKIQAGQFSRITYTAPARGSYPDPIPVAIQSQQPRSLYSQGGTVASSMPFQQYGSFPQQQRQNPPQMMMKMNGTGTSGSERAYSPPAPPLLSTTAATRSTATSTPSAAKTAGDKQVVLGGEVVTLINDADYFEPIRRMEGVSLSDVGSEAQFSFKSLGAGGGKVIKPLNP